jgi:hypothetical protein
MCLVERTVCLCPYTAAGSSPLTGSWLVGVDEKAKAFPNALQQQKKHNEQEKAAADKRPL